MLKNWAKWACEHGKITKIWLSDGCGDGTIPMTVKLCTVGVDLKVFWEMSA